MTSYPSVRAEFFTVGGALRHNAPSYVPRPADIRLRELVLQGELCYVLTTRQMGKSSLMIRTARYLQQQGIRTAIVDLTGIGTAPPEQWLLSFLDEVHTQLGLQVELETWWKEHQAYTPINRFTRFIREVIPQEINQQVVIFVDEVDAALRLNFSDDFFAAIRSIYSQPTEESPKKGVSFVLLGVATPNDLIQDPTRTPFNVGTSIRLGELQQVDTWEIFAQALPGDGKVLLDRVFYWTGGHPYLTQKVCQAITRQGEHDWTSKEVDALVEQLFFTRQAIAADSNLQFVGNRVLASPKSPQLLQLYRRLLAGRPIPSDDHSQLQSELKLYGLITAAGFSHARQPVPRDYGSPTQQELHMYGLAGTDGEGNLQVPNRIYQRVFDHEWVKEHTPTNKWRNLAIIAVIAAIVASIALLAILFRATRSEDVLAEIYVEDFTSSTNPVIRLTSLADLIQLEKEEHAETARQLFFNLSSSEQRALFTEDPALYRQTLVLVQEIYTALPAASFTTATESTVLLFTMQSAVAQATDAQGKAVHDEISIWLQGRQHALAGDYDIAMGLYQAAISLNQDNPALRFEQAQVLFNLEDYSNALSQLESLVPAGAVWEERARVLLRSDPRWLQQIEQRRSPLLEALLTAPALTPTPTATPAESDFPGILAAVATIQGFFSQRAESGMARATSPPTEAAALLLPPSGSRIAGFAASETPFATTTADPGAYTNPTSRATSAPNLSPTPLPTRIPPTPTPTATPAPIRIAETVIGTTVEGVNITAFELGSGPRKVVVVSGLHAGFAPSSVSFADRLLTYVLDSPLELPPDITLIIIPNANPDSILAPGQKQGRLNANGVDLNRNWDCNWSPEALWLQEPIDPGSAPFSEPETSALRDFFLDLRPDAVIVYGARSTVGEVIPGGCGERHEDSDLYTSFYAQGSGYQITPGVDGPTGDITNWLSLQDIPALFVLLKEYDSLSEEDFANNLDGLLRVLENLLQ